MPTRRRFAIWICLTLAATLGLGMLGYILPPGSQKLNLIIAFQVACNLFLAWLLGLIRFRDKREIGLSGVVIVWAISVRTVLIVLAIITTLFCGIDACGS